MTTMNTECSWHQRLMSALLPLLVLCSSCAPTGAAGAAGLSVKKESGLFVVEHLDSMAVHKIKLGISYADAEAAHRPDILSKEITDGMAAMKVKNTLPGAYGYTIEVFDRNEEKRRQNPAEFWPRSPAVRVLRQTAVTTLLFAGEKRDAPCVGFQTSFLMSDIDMMALDGSAQRSAGEDELPKKLTGDQERLKTLYLASYGFLKAKDLGFTDMAMLTGEFHGFMMKVLLNARKNSQEVEIVRAPR